MSLYAMSDLHLSLAENVDKPMDKFGLEWKDHTKRLEASWKETIKDEDYVLIPGDISWGINLDEASFDLEFIDRLPGEKILLRGNHDFWWASMKKMRGMYKSIDFIQNDVYECEDYVICGTRGWLFPWKPSKHYSATESEKIFNREMLRARMSLEMASKIRNGRKLVFASHFPPLDAVHTGTKVTELLQEFKVDIAVYGHLHGEHHAEAVNGKIGGIEYYLVSFDALDSKPLKLL